MMGLSIITGELFSWLDVSQGIELHKVSNPPQERIRSTGMVDKFKLISLLRAIYSPAVV